MAVSVDICNRALQKIGSPTIATITDNNDWARACGVAYDPLRLAELRLHPWNFAKRRASLAASTTSPVYGRAYYFPLPSNFLRLLKDPDYNYNDRDWQIERSGIATNDPAPINILYISDITNVDAMDPLFREALATKMALEMVETLTQSNTKKQLLQQDYQQIIVGAKKANAIENVPVEPTEDTWISVRR